MKESLVGKLGLALIALMVVFLGARWLESRSLAPRAVALDLSTLDEKAVDKILVEGIEETSLTRSGDAWAVGKYQAADVSQFLDNVKATRVQDVVSRDKSKHSVFEVDDEAGVRIRLYDGARVAADFLVGKQAFAGSFYLRLPGKDEVYQARGGLSAYTTRTLQDWVDKTIVSVDQDKITAVELKYPKETIVLERKDGDWQIGGEKVERTLADTLITNLASLEGREVETVETPQFSEPDAELEISVDGQQAQNLVFKKKDEKDYWVRGSGKNVIYLLDASAAEAVLITKEDLEQN